MSEKALVDEEDMASYLQRCGELRRARGGDVSRLGSWWMLYLDLQLELLYFDDEWTYQVWESIFLACQKLEGCRMSNCGSRLALERGRPMINGLCPTEGRHSPPATRSAVHVR